MIFLNRVFLFTISFLLLLIVFNFQIFGLPINFIFALFFFLFLTYLKFNVEIFELTLFYFLILGLALYFSNGNIEGLKFLRTLISIFVLRVIFYNFLSRYNYWKILYYILFAHTLVVVVCFFYPDLVDIIGPSFGFEKDVKLVRFAGLTSGYDLSGIVIISSLIILDNKRFSILGCFSTFKYFFYFIISLVGLLLTSRFSFVFFLVYLISGLTYNAFHRWILVFLVIIIYTILPSVVELFDAVLMTLNLKEIERGNFYYEYINLSYSQTSSIEDVASSHFLLFYKNVFQLFFGFSSVPHRSDVGFVNYINNYGIFNLFLLLVIYFKYFKNIVKLRMDFSHKRIFYFLFFLFFVATFKNSYIFTRTSFEIFYLVYLFTRNDFKIISN